MDLEMIKKHVRAWTYYDNDKKGPDGWEYVNENASGYGPIKVYNALVLIEGDEVFSGDVSLVRFRKLKAISKEHGLKIKIFSESRDMWFWIRNGKARRYMKSHKPRISKKEMEVGLSALFG